MGTTTKWQIPYVDPPDLLAAYPVADKAKADKVDSQLTVIDNKTARPAPTWKTLTPASGFVAYNAALTPQYAILDGWQVHMRGLIKKSTGSLVNNDILANLPAEAIPKREYTFNVVTTNTSSASAPNIRLVFQTTGAILVLTASANTPGNWASVDGILYDMSQA